MARPAYHKQEVFNERVDTRYKDFAKLFNDMDELTADNLRSYCVVCEQLDDVNQQIQNTGYFVSLGDHKKENPAIGTAHKLNSDKLRYATWLKRVLNKQEEAAASDEEIATFMGI